MHVAITGGSGFLGRALTTRLRADGFDVTWLSRDVSRDAPEGVSVRDYTSLWSDDVFEAVVNLAGAGIAEQRWSDDRKRELLDSRLMPTQVVIDWIRSAHTRPRVLLSGSAVGWYGAQGEQALDESSPPHDEFQHRLCARWEDAACAAEASGVPVVRVRTGVVLHPDGGMLKRLLLPFRLGLGGRLGAGSQMLSWISRDDWVEGVMHLLRAHLEPGDAPPTGAFNLTAPVPVDNAAFTRALAHALHRPAVLAVPARVLQLGLGEMSTLLLDGQRALPARLQQRDHVWRWPELAPYLESVLR